MTYKVNEEKKDDFIDILGVYKKKIFDINILNNHQQHT